MAKSMTVGKRENEKKRLAKREAKFKKKRGQCKNLRGKFINCYLCLQIHSLWS